ncbi:isochorismatase family hydrolase [Aspergillus arachidicola]|uniref:Isochorismatase family hydrolase n=1 Tax=Aspergillus arachidicola TaxID=656916 RepID=A0A2G7FUG3_9EURO|nr:isochorismatase family hydrolase [Aspergillus arachidicola]
MTLKNLRLGIAIGHGTGRELTVVFKTVIQELARQHSLQVDFIESSRIYHSYHSLTTSSGDKDLIQHIAEETTQDAEEYRKFCETATANGIAAIFRTAIHAQSLYLVRGQLKAVKIEHFNLGNSNALLFIRDEAQGFYAGENEYHDSRHSIIRTSPFTRSTFDQILEFALERAKEEWGVENVPKAVILVYKFHLFDGVLSWAPHWQRRFGIELDFIQPDTMNRNLMASGIQGRRIIIAGNEYADIIQPVFLKWFSNATIETMCAENVYLSPSLHRLSEYQTVHGSADAIAGQGLVNPFATIRAAAAILERHGGCPRVGFQSQTERVIQTLSMKKRTTPDQGGSCSTDAVVEHFLRAMADPATIDNPSIGRDIATGPIDAMAGKKTAVVVVDYQNDFIASTPSHVVSELSSTVPRLVQYARNGGSEVIFLAVRNALLGKPEKCIEGTWGAELGSGVTPRPREQVFDKKALFDSFLVPEFSEYVSEQGFEHLVLAGLYSDVCVDATARTAFQKGLWVTVVEDCTTALHLNHSDHLKFMEKVYGARIVKLASLIEMKA